MEFLDEFDEFEWHGIMTCSFYWAEWQFHSQTQDHPPAQIFSLGDDRRCAALRARGPDQFGTLALPI